MSEVPTCQPPEGVHGPTLGIAMPDGCERLLATWDPHTASADRWLASGAAVDEYLYWWRFPPLKPGDRVQLTGTVDCVDLDGGVWVPPAPPWPGAVLSGLVDEDGEPTWLAQAGQVRGEQVRACTSVPWLPNTSYGEDEWVEVRAPRAVPEPETERVPWWEAVGRQVPGGAWIKQVGAPYATTKDGKPVPVVNLDNGTPGFEVLKDGDR